MAAGSARAVPQDDVLVTLISEALNAPVASRRTAAELLLNALRAEHAFGGPKAVAKLLNPGLSPDVLAEIDDFVQALALDPHPLSH